MALRRATRVRRARPRIAIGRFSGAARGRASGTGMTAPSGERAPSSGAMSGGILAAPSGATSGIIRSAVRREDGRRRDVAHPGANDALASAEARVRPGDVQHARIDDRPGHQGCLIGLDRRRRHAEIGSSRGFGAPDAVAPLDGVEVELEDTRLAQLVLEPARDEQLASASAADCAPARGRDSWRAAA